MDALQSLVTLFAFLALLATQALDDVCGDLRRGGIATIRSHTTERGANGVVVVAIGKGGVCDTPRDFHRIDTRTEGLADVCGDFYDEVVVLDVRGGRGAFSACIVEDFDAQTLKACEVKDFPRRLSDQLEGDAHVRATLDKLEGLLGLAPCFSSEDVHVRLRFG